MPCGAQFTPGVCAVTSDVCIHGDASCSDSRVILDGDDDDDDDVTVPLSCVHCACACAAPIPFSTAALVETNERTDDESESYSSSNGNHFITRFDARPDSAHHYGRRVESSGSSSIGS